MSKFRCVLVVSFTLALVPAVSACGGSSSGQRTSEAPGSRAHVEPPKKSVSVTLLTSGSADQLVLERQQIAAFEKRYPTIHVNLKIVPYSQEAAVLRATIAGKSNINIVTTFPGAAAASYASGLIPLDPYITAADRKRWPLLASSISPDGKIYSLPVNAYAYAYAYNKKIFSEAGVQPPKTWDDLLGLCEQLSSEGTVPIAAGWKDGNYAEGFMYQAADMLLTKKEAEEFARLELPVDSPPFEKAVDTLLELKEHQCFSSKAPGINYYEELRDEFAAGKAAIVLEPTGGGPVEQGGLYPEELGEKNVGVFPPPPVPGSHYEKLVDYGPNQGYSITSFSSQEQQEAAWLFLEYLLSKQAQEFQWEFNGTFPAVNDVSLKTDYEPTAKVFEWIKWPDDYTTYTSFPAAATSVYVKQAVPLMTGELEPSAMLAEMQQAIELEKPKLTSRP